MNSFHSVSVSSCTQNYAVVPFVNMSLLCSIRCSRPIRCYFPFYSVSSPSSIQDKILVSFSVKSMFLSYYAMGSIHDHVPVPLCTTVSVPFSTVPPPSPFGAMFLFLEVLYPISTQYHKTVPFSIIVVSL